MRGLAFIGAGLALLLGIASWDDGRAEMAIDAAATDCRIPARPNPCAMVDCNRPDTKRIA